MDWISVENKLPLYHGIYLYAQHSGCVGVCRYKNDASMPWRERFKYIDGSEITVVNLTHWMPLPEPPPGVKEE